MAAVKRVSVARIPADIYVSDFAVQHVARCCYNRAFVTAIDESDCFYLARKTSDVILPRNTARRGAVAHSRFAVVRARITEQTADIRFARYIAAVIKAVCDKFEFRRVP